MFSCLVESDVPSGLRPIHLRVEETGKYVGVVQCRVRAIPVIVQHAEDTDSVDSVSFVSTSRTSTRVVVKEQTHNPFYSVSPCFRPSNNFCWYIPIFPIVFVIYFPHQP